MRLDINLATRPYRDVKRFLTRWGTATAIFVLGSIVFAAWAYHSWQAARGINHQISITRQQIQKLDDQRAAAVKMLNDPANRNTAETSRFLNQMIARKAFSWTSVFMQMEEILPEGMHVVAMTPELTKNNLLELTMRVAGGSHDRAVEFVKRLEKSPSFRSPALRAESMTPIADPKTGDTVEFQISTLYVPGAAPPLKKNTETTASTESKESTPVEAKAKSRSAKGARP